MMMDREKEICDRLRRFREILQIPRTTFSLRIGISSERLYSYEVGRAALRYEIFAAVQKQYSINPAWLATGEGSPRLDDWSDEAFRGQVLPRELFSAVYDRLIERRLVFDRMNKDGRDHLLKSAAQYSEPKVLARLKQARETAGVSLGTLAATLSAAMRTKITEKQLRAIESGKTVPTARMMIGWRYEARINEQWAKTGKGEMFTIPDWKNAEYLDRIRMARLDAKLSHEALAEKLAAVCVARISELEMQSIEDGKMILTHSVELGLPLALGVEREALFPVPVEKQNSPMELRRSFDAAKATAETLSRQLAELEQMIFKS